MTITAHRPVFEAARFRQGLGHIPTAVSVVTRQTRTETSA